MPHYIVVNIVKHVGREKLCRLYDHVQSFRSQKSVIGSFHIRKCAGNFFLLFPVLKPLRDLRHNRYLICFPFQIVHGYSLCKRCIISRKLFQFPRNITGHFISTVVIGVSIILGEIESLGRFKSVLKDLIHAESVKIHHRDFKVLSYLKALLGIFFQKVIIPAFIRFPGVSCKRCHYDGKSSCLTGFVYIGHHPVSVTLLGL